MSNPNAKMYDAELEGLTDHMFKNFQRMLDNSNVMRSCINCHYFAEHQGEICTMYNHQRPPARIIARGCDQHSKEVPF